MDNWHQQSEWKVSQKHSDYEYPERQDVSLNTRLLIKESQFTLQHDYEHSYVTNRRDQTYKHSLEYSGSVEEGAAKEEVLLVVKNRCRDHYEHYEPPEDIVTPPIQERFHLPTRALAVDEQFVIRADRVASGKDQLLLGLSQQGPHAELANFKSGCFFDVLKKYPLLLNNE